MNRSGVLPAQTLRLLIAQGAIKAHPPVDPSQVQPASLDLRLGTKAYRVRASFLAGAGRKVSARLEEFTMHEVDLTKGAVLEKGCVYVIPLMESLALPAGLSAVANAKSSTGRLDLLTRTITDGGAEFDRIPEGYKGPLYAEVCPRSFSVLVRAGQRLNQIRFRYGHAVLSDDQLRTLHAQDPLVSGTPVISEGLGFSVDLRPAQGDLLGYRAKPHTGVVDLDRIAHYPAQEFWEEVRATNGQIILDPGAFYILVSREAVTIPPRLRRRDGTLSGDGGRISRALRRLLRSRLWPCHSGRGRFARGVGSALSRSALCLGTWPSRGPLGLRGHDRAPRYALWHRDCVELSRPRPETRQTV